MKTIITTAGLLLLAFIANSQVKKEKLYPFKTAIVEYTYEGNTTGTQTLQIANYGWLQHKTEKTVSKVFGQKTEVNKVEITRDFDIYQWDPASKTGTKLRNAIAEELLKDPGFDPEEFGKRTMLQLGFEKTGTETVNGKECEVWKGLGSTIWIWNSLAIKTEVKILGTKTVTIATNVKIDAPVHDGLFTIPSDVKFTDMGTNDPIEMMNKASQNQPAGSDMHGQEEEIPIKNLKDLKGLLKKINQEK